MLLTLLWPPTTFIFYYKLNIFVSTVRSNLNMIMVASFLFFFIMVDAQNSTDMQNPYLEKSPARNILPRILEVAKHYQETFGNNEQNIKTKSFSECIKKNIILTKKVSHRRRHSLKHCLKQAFQRKYINAYESLSDRLKDGNTKQDYVEKTISRIVYIMLRYSY